MGRVGLSRRGDEEVDLAQGVIGRRGNGVVAPGWVVHLPPLPCVVHLMQLVELAYLLLLLRWWHAPLHVGVRIHRRVLLPGDLEVSGAQTR